MNKHYKKRKSHLGIMVILLLLFIVFGISILSKSTKNITVRAEKTNSINSKMNYNPVQVKSTIKISSIGNILFHGPQIKAAKTSTAYDFNPSFKYISSLFSNSDITIGTLETTLGGSNFSGYPCFNSPDEVIPALKNMGINVINYANNHILDSHSVGFRRTLSTTAKYNMDTVGVRSNTDNKRYLIKEIKGEKIGIISYVYETPKVSSVSTINSIPIAADIIGLVNTFDYENLNDFYNDVSNNINEMKNDGANFIIVQLHWGDEYSTKANSYQKAMSKKLNELGVDIILGGHPHVIEPYEIITNSNGKKTFVVYSQGNFISNQSYETLGNAKTEDGIVINFTLEDKNGYLHIKDYNVIPTWVYRVPKENGLYKHTVIPVNDAIENKDKFNIPNSAYIRVERSLTCTKDIVGEDGLGIHKFPVD